MEDCLFDVFFAVLSSLFSNHVDQNLQDLIKKKTFEVFKPTLYWLILNMLLYFRMVQHQPDLDIASTVHPLTLKRKNNLHLQSNFEYNMLEEISCSQNTEVFSGYSHNNLTFINFFHTSLHILS